MIDHRLVSEPNNAKQMSISAPIRLPSYTLSPRSQAPFFDGLLWFSDRGSLAMCICFLQFPRQHASSLWKPWAVYVLALAAIQNVNVTTLTDLLRNSLSTFVSAFNVDWVRVMNVCMVLSKRGDSDLPKGIAIPGQVDDHQTTTEETYHRERKYGRPMTSDYQ